MLQALGGLIGRAAFHAEDDVQGALVLDGLDDPIPVQHSLAAPTAHRRSCHFAAFRVRVLIGYILSVQMNQSFDDPIETLAVGDPVWEPGFRRELSVLTRGGALYTFALDVLGQPEASALEPVARFEASRSESSRRLIALRATGQPADELLLLDLEVAPEEPDTMGVKRTSKVPPLSLRSASFTHR